MGACASSEISTGYPTRAFPRHKHCNSFVYFGGLSSMSTPDDYVSRHCTTTSIHISRLPRFPNSGWSAHCKFACLAPDNIPSRRRTLSTSSYTTMPPNILEIKQISIGRTLKHGTIQLLILSIGGSMLQRPTSSHLHLQLTSSLFVVRPSVLSILNIEIDD